MTDKLGLDGLGGKSVRTEPTPQEEHERNGDYGHTGSSPADVGLEPVNTNTPEVSQEHLLAIARKCGLIGYYTTRAIIDAITGYAQVVLRDKAVQEAFLRANPNESPSHQTAVVGLEPVAYGVQVTLDGELAWNTLWDEKWAANAHLNSLLSDGIYEGESHVVSLYSADTIEALRKDAERYRWILHQAKITDTIFDYIKSDERHVSNAIDAAMKESL